MPLGLTSALEAKAVSYEISVNYAIDQDNCLLLTYTVFIKVSDYIRFESGSFKLEPKVLSHFLRVKSTRSSKNQGSKATAPRPVFF